MVARRLVLPGRVVGPAELPPAAARGEEKGGGGRDEGEELWYEVAFGGVVGSEGEALAHRQALRRRHIFALFRPRTTAGVTAGEGGMFGEVPASGDGLDTEEC